MRRWLSCELTHDEWNKVRVFMHLYSIRYESSGTGNLIHIEVYANDTEAQAVNTLIDTL